MNSNQWKCFCEFKKEFRQQVEAWTKLIPNLAEIQRKAALDSNNPDYSFETPVVYNTDLDKITQEDDIRLIVIGDNPGKAEQLKINNRYLVGQAGKLADGFFRNNPELNIDFRKNVIILNKTPVHSAKTAQLKKMMAYGGEPVKNLIKESQLWMAKATAKLHQQLWENAETEEEKTELWLVGYSELKPRGLFIDYKNELQSSYTNKTVWDEVFVFQHFSMNCFTSDLKQFRNNRSESSLSESIHELGRIHKKEIFG